MRFHLPADKMPTAWFNVMPRLDEPVPPPLHPGTREPVGPDDLAPLFPMALIGQEVSRRAVDRHPRRGARHPPAVAADASRARRAARARARHACAHLLQGRVGLAGGLAQAEHRSAAGLLQQGRGHRTTHHRDRRRAVGHGAGVRVQPVRPRVQGVHGPRVVQPEAVPQDHDGDVGCRVRAVAGRRPRLARLARARDLRRGPRRGEPRRHPLLARLGAESRAVASDGHRSRGQGAARTRRRDAARRRHRAVRRRIEPRRPLAAVRRGPLGAPGRGRAGVVPDAHRGTLRLRLRRHRRHDAAAADVHARPRLHAAADPRRWAALPRRLADHLPPRAHGADGGARVPAGKGVRGLEAVRPRRGPGAGARVRPRHPGRDRRGARRKEEGSERVILFNYCGHGLLDLSAYDDFNHGRLIDA